MGNYKTKGAMYLLGKHTATTTESTKTFTLNIDFNQWSVIQLVIDGATTAALNLELKINSVTSGYYMEGRRIAAGSETILDDNALAHFTIISSTLTGSNANFTARAELQNSVTANTDYITCKTEGHYPSDQQSELRQGDCVASGIASITSLIVETSTSTWKAGTHITIYGTRR